MAHSPDYERVYDTVVEKIKAGKWPPGAELPPIRALAKMMGVSESTVKHAHRLLRRDGWTVGHSGKGVFVADPLPPR